MRLTTALAAVLAIAAPAWSAPPPAQLCRSALELGSAKFSSCRLVAESKFTKSGDAGKLGDARERCSEKLSLAFSKAIGRYGVACAATVTPGELDAYLTMCTDDTAAASGGVAFPDYAALLATCQQKLASCEAAPPAALLETGQTTSWGAGSDGSLQIGVDRSYVDNGDGTIFDVRTGLTWEKKSDDGGIHDKDALYTWSTGAPWSTTGTAFTTFLATLNSGGGFAGHTDWRMPNLLELESIVDYEAVGVVTSAAFDTACAPGCTVLSCSCTAPGGHHTSSTRETVTSARYEVDFTGGGVGLGPKNTGHAVRAVRGGA